jgi:hypothetical protein
MIGLLRIRQPLRLSAVRLRRRLRVAALTAVAIAAAAAALALVLAGSLVTQDRSTAGALEKLPPRERSLQVAFFGIPATGALPSLDSAARRALREIVPTSPARVLQVKTISIEGVPVQLRAIDDLRRWVRLGRGRLPTVCSPQRCEVVRLAGAGSPPAAPGLRLVVVGSATLLSPVPFGRFSGDSEVEGAPARRTTTLLAGDVSSLAELPALASIYRSYAWVAPLPGGAARPWMVEALGRRLDRARSELRVVSDGFDLTAPTRALTEAASTARVAGQRLLLIGGEIVALILALAVLAAASMRRDVDALRRRLTWAGASRWQIFLVIAAEAALVVTAGVLSGWVVGVGLAWLVAHASGAAAGEIVVHAALSLGGLAVAVALGLAALVVLLLALLTPSVKAGRRSLSLLDAAAVASIVVLAFALARGRVTAAELSRDGGAATVLLLLPGLVCFGAAVGCARLLRPALRALEHVTRRRSVTLRTAALSLVRNPGYAGIAVSFLAVALGLTLFAVAYRATLDRGLVDQARYAVPATYVVRERLDADALVNPLRAASLEQWQALGRGVSAAPVIRQQGSVSQSSGSRRQYTLLGVSSEALATLDGWRADFASQPLRALATAITPTEPVALRGPLLPPDATAVEVSLRSTGGEVLLRLGVLTRRGEITQLELRTTSPTVRRAAVPRAARGGRVIGIELIRALAVESHRKNEAPVVSGALTLGSLQAVTPRGLHPLAENYAGWIGRGRVDATAQRGAVSLRYLVGNDVVSQFRPRQPLEESPLPVLASPGLAAIADRDGILALRLGTGRIILKVVGTIARFPSTEGDVVVADEASLFTAGNTVRAGAASATELWLFSPRSLDGALGRATFDVLDVASQRERLDALRSDPLTRGSLIALASCAAVALLLAAIGFLVLVLSDLRDERGELFHLEAQGAAPTVLRRHLQLRALLVAGAGLVGGLLTGLALVALVAETVVVTANGIAPQPPLLVRLDWLLLAGVVAVYVVLVVAVVVGATRSSFRTAFPVRGPVSDP